MKRKHVDRKRFFIAGLTLIVLLVLPITGVERIFATEKGPAPRAKNVVLMIADGMGFNCDIAGTCYRYGKEGTQSYQAFPVILGCTTFSRSKKDRTIPEDYLGYVPDIFWDSLQNGNQGTSFTRTTDSAASSTAIHGGQKTLSGHLGMLPDGKPIELISEVAAKAGKKSGTVTTVYLSHATPAGFATHLAERRTYEMLLHQMISESSPLSVVIGSGHPLYERGEPIPVPDKGQKKKRRERFQFVGGEETWKTMQAGSINGFTFVDALDRFEEIASGKKDIPDKLIGVIRCLGFTPPVDGDLPSFLKTRKLLEDTFPKTDWKEMSSLSTLSVAALNVLDKNNEEGFVVMIEGGCIDRANHQNNITRAVLEHTGFSKAIDTVTEWIEKNSSWDETLLIVTADHETGQIWGPNTFEDDNENGGFDEGDLFHEFKPVENRRRGKIPKVQYANKGHSNALVPLYAKGVGSDLFLKRIKGTDKRAGEFWKFSGDYVDNTDIFHVVKSLIE